MSLICRREAYLCPTGALPSTSSAAERAEVLFEEIATDLLSTSFRRDELRIRSDGDWEM